MRAEPTNPTTGREGVVIAALVVLTNGPVLYLSRLLLRRTPAWEDVVVRPFLVATALVAVGLVALDPLRESGVRLRRPDPAGAVAVAGFTGWALLSSIWSVDPGLTRGRAMVYVGLAALAWVVADLGGSARRRVLLGVAVVAVASSAVTTMVSSSAAYDVGDDLRGIYTNRNSLGPLAAVGVLAAVGAMPAARGRRRVVPAGIAIASLGVLGATGSRTATIGLGAAAVVATVLVGSARLGGKPRSVRWVAPIVGGAGALVAGVVVGAMWDDPTLVQRRMIWDMVWEEGARRPLVGHGWFAMWADPDFTGRHELLDRGSAHGSMPEVWLGLGAVGLVAFVAVVALALFGAGREAWHRPGADSWVWLAVVVLAVLENVTESFVLWFSYNWVLIMAAALRGAGGPRRPRDGRIERPNATVSG